MEELDLTKIDVYTIRELKAELSTQNVMPIGSFFSINYTISLYDGQTIVGYVSTADHVIFGRRLRDALEGHIPSVVLNSMSLHRIPEKLAALNLHKLTVKKKARRKLILDE